MSMGISRFRDPLESGRGRGRYNDSPRNNRTRPHTYGQRPLANMTNQCAPSRGGGTGLSQTKRRSSGRHDAICVEKWEAPVDENGNIMSIPLILEMEKREDENGGRSEGREKELMAYYASEFVAEAELHGVEIVAVEELQFIKERSRYVMPLQVSSPNWQAILIPLMRSFYVGVERNRVATHEMPIVSTHSTLLYPLRLLSIHDNVPIARVQFGSILNNGRLGIHWLMVGGPQTLDDRNNNFTFPKEIYASFEYDKRTICIEYNNVEADVNNRERDYEVRGKIMVEMSSIHRVIVDQKKEEEPASDDRKISLVFILDSPPQFQVQRRYDKTRRQYVGNSPWEYRDELQRGVYPGERSDKEALHLSKALVLQFDCHAIEEKIKDPNSSMDAYFFDIISRLRHRTGRMIEFASFDQMLLLKGEVKDSWRDSNGKLQVELRTRLVHPYDHTILSDQRLLLSSHNDSSAVFFDDTVSRYMTAAARKLVQPENIIDGLTWDYHIRWKVFRLHALLHGILDRGMEYRIELLRSRYHSPSTWHKFVEMVADRYGKDEKKTLLTLERMMSLIGEGRPNCSIPFLFEREWAESTTSRQRALYNEDEKKEGYWRIMKIVVTPTRVIFVGYEVIMGNRVLNTYAKNENHIIRLSFREDRGGQIRGANCKRDMQARITNILLNGITYAGRTFAWLGNSNSQMREQGVYMMHVDFADRSSERPQDIQSRMGDFHLLPNVPKMIARLGQVFTQSKASEIALLPSEVDMDYEYTGGMNAAGQQFVFSDGVGLISAEHAQALSKEHGITGGASAFQIRFRGEKGLLSVDPLIDKRNDVLEMMGKGEEKKKILVRPSMSKFNVIENGRSNLEIVKLSTSTALFLNKPLINILCQVSEKQSPSCHKRVRERVGELLSAMVMDNLQPLYIEKKAIEEIKEMPIPFSIEVYNQSSGLEFTTEPFFRSLLRANAKYVLQKRMKKMNIRIPTSNGRLMFGVVDTTGLLQFGQVFIQYSGSMRRQGLKMRSIGGQQGIVHSGPTMITKNPCISSGDVRMFDAVDIPALRHLVDVVVFPQHGPRPHPDEMAGSDLDGDEYMVFWDEKLLLERSEEASVFPIGNEMDRWTIPKKRNGQVDLEKCEEKKAEFFSQAIIYGQPGQMCTAHIALSDLHGLDSKPSKSLAHKINQTFDFPKSGITPGTMTAVDVDDPDDWDRIIPAERSKIKPDFLRNYREPGYESRGILGEVFRESAKYEHALDCGKDEKEKIELDVSFLIPGREEYEETVKEELMNYTHAMKDVFHQYGIATEEEMISGMIMSMTNPLSENEEFDGTHFTTIRVIEGKVKRIIEDAREKLFDGILDWKTDLDEIEGRKCYANSDSICNRRVKQYTKKMEAIRRKVSAAYEVAYQAANRSVERGEQTPILLSYPWIFYDVLLDIKTRPDERMVASEDGRGRYSDPLSRILSEFIDRYCESNLYNWVKYNAFVTKFESDDSIVSRSMKENDGLARTSFVLREWARNAGGLNSSFDENHLITLFVQFGLGELSSSCGLKRRFIQKPRGDQREHPRKGEHLLMFFEYVASREFRMRSNLSFAAIGGGILMRGEWKAFSETALSSFLSLISTHRLDLPIEEDSGKEASKIAVREFEARAMQLPKSVVANELNAVKEALMDVSGCKLLEVRDVNSQLIMISAAGTIEQLKILASYIYPPAPPRETSTLRGTIDSLAEFTYKRLMDAAEKIQSSKADSRIQSL